MSEWQPIESAPKDGTHVILLVDDVAIEGWYGPRWDGDTNPAWSYVRLSSHGCGCCGSDDGEPTAWIPLPGAPPEPPK